VAPPYLLARSFAVCLGAGAVLAGCADVRPPVLSAELETTPRLGDAAVGVRPTPSSAGSTESPRKAPDAPQRSAATTPRAHPYTDAVGELEASAVAIRYADLAPAACLAEVAKRKLSVAAASSPTAGVATPMTITGPLRGVRFVVPGGDIGVLDCRLALALDDLSALLAGAGVTKVRIDNFHRKGAHLPGKRSPSQHAFALAADIDSLTFADGTTLTPGEDWHAAIGATSCGPDAVMESPDRASIALRDLVCEVAREGLFHHILTPSFNAAHRTHFHFDLQEGQKRGSVR
jgi:hypothetical protein